ncbi:MAG: TonB-dependent receptor [Fibrobacterota bacterium]
MKTGELKSIIISICLSFTASVCGDAKKADSSDVYELGKMVVTATKSEKAVGDVPASVSVISENDINQKNGYLADQIMSDIPGVYMQKGNIADIAAGSDMSMRGVPGGKNILIMYNGVPLNEPFWGSGHIELAAVSLGNIERIEVVKGPFSSLHGGNAMAGVINLVTRDPFEDKVVLASSYGTNNTITNRLNISKKIGPNLGLSLNYDKIFSEGIESAYFSASGVTEVEGTDDLTEMTEVTGVRAVEDISGEGYNYLIGTPGKSGWDQDKIGASLSYRLNNEHSLMFNNIFSDRTVDHDGPKSFLRNDDGSIFTDGDYYFEHNGDTLKSSASTVDFLQRMRVTPRNEKNLLSSLSYEGLIGANELNITVGRVTHQLKRVKKRYSGATVFGGPAQFNQINNLSYSFDAYALRPVKDHSITLGVAVKNNRGKEDLISVSDWRNPEDSKETVTSEVVGRNMLYSGYLQGVLAVIENLDLYIGGRYDYWDNYFGESIQRSSDGEQSEKISYEPAGNSNFSPKAALRYKLSNKLSLRTSVGQAFNAPCIADLYRTTMSWGRRISYSNPELDPEIITSGDFGADVKLFGAKTLLKADFFYNRLSNMITSKKMDYQENGFDVYKNVNIGLSHSMGTELEVNHKITDWLDFYGNYTFTFSEFLENDLDTTIIGKQFPEMPENMYNLALRVKSGDFGGNIAWNYADKVYMDAANEQKVWDVYGSRDAVMLLNSKVSYKLTDNFKVAYGVTNILDREYFKGKWTGKADGRRHVFETQAEF